MPNQAAFCPTSPFTSPFLLLVQVVHDFEHRGRTNDFLINSSDALALRYNDAAPMENHHLAAAFTIMTHSPCSFLAHLPKVDSDARCPGI